MSDHELPANDETLRKRVLKYKFVILFIVFFFIGSALIFFGEDGVGHLGRDIGITLLIAGIVGLPVEYWARKEAEIILRDIAKDSIQEHAWPKLQEINGSVQDHDLRSRQGMEQVLSVSQNLESKIQEIGTLLVSNNLRALGVKQMYVNRSPDLLSYIQQAPRGSTIRLLAISLNRLVAAGARNVLRKKLKEGCTIQALVIDPKSEYVRLRALEEMEEREGPKPTQLEVEHHVKAFVKRVHDRDSLLLNLKDDLPPDLQERFEIRHYDMPAYCFLMDNDRTMLVGFYLRDYPGEDCPHIELDVRDGGAYLSFRRHFDSLWKTPVLADRRKKNLPFETERRHPPVLSDLSPEVAH